MQACIGGCQAFFSPDLPHSGWEKVRVSTIHLLDTLTLFTHHPKVHFPVWNASVKANAHFASCPEKSRPETRKNWAHFVTPLFNAQILIQSLILSRLTACQT